MCIMSTDRRDTGKGQLLRGFVLDDAVRVVVSLDDAVRVYFCGGTSLSVRDV